MTNPNYPNAYNYNGYPGYDPGIHERKKRAKWVGLGVGAVAASIAAGTILYLSSPTAEATIHPSETSNSSGYDGAIDEQPTDSEQSNEENGETVKNTPKNEYPRPSVGEARITVEGDPSNLEDDLQSMEDVPDAFAKKLSEWLMAGATVETYHEYLAFNGTIEDFTTQKAEENAPIYLDALFGGNNIISQETVARMTRENATALARFLTSVNNDEVTEAYEAKFVVADDTIDEAYAITEGDWVFRLETNANNAVNPDDGYFEPFGGNGAEVGIQTDLWMVDESGEPVYGDAQFGQDGTNNAEKHWVRFDNMTFTSSQTTNT